MDTKNNINIEPFEADYAGAYAEFYFSFDGKKIDTPRCLITTREAGSMGLNFPSIDSGINENMLLPGEIFFTPNRIAFYNSLRIDPLRVHSCRQTHTRDVAVVEYLKSPLLQKADGLISEKNAILTVTVGDCLPVYLYDTKNDVFAICHSGWKGTGIATDALAIMKTKYGTNAKDVSAILGPCIRCGDYEVDAERAKEFNDKFADADGGYPLGEVIREITLVNDCAGASCGEKKYYLDMQAANAHILVRYGVANIRYCTDSTFTDTRLGSYRREGKDFTKMLAMIGRF
jgi:YfiH family protein